MSLGRALLALKHLSLRVDPVNPWLSPRAEKLDRDSFAGWLDAVRLSGRARKTLEGTICGFATVGAEELSLLQVLWWVRRAGGLLPALRNGSALRIVEGAQAVPLRLAARLHRPVILSAPVVSVEQYGQGVTVRDEHGYQVRARRAIVAVPLPALRAITFSPPLTAAQRALVEQVQFGRAVKVSAASPPSPPARHRAFVGGGTLSIGWRTGGVLAGIARARNTEHREDEMVADLTGAFGVPSAVAAETIHWGRERFAGGTYAAFAPGQLVRHGPHLRRPHDAVYFAGAERSSWANQMEGAVESGMEAARRVLEEIRGRPPSEQAGP